MLLGWLLDFITVKALIHVQLTSQWLLVRKRMVGFREGKSRGACSQPSITCCWCDPHLNPQGLFPRVSLLILRKTFLRFSCGASFKRAVVFDAKT